MFSKLRLSAWIPIGLGCVVILSAAFSRSPLRDAATLGLVSEASLLRPTGYVLLSPYSNALDVLTLLTVGQHIAFLLTIMVCYAVWWTLQGGRALDQAVASRRWLREAARVGVGALGVIAIYAAAALLPRPMARIETGQDILAIDFHSHTGYSHDGRSGWSAEDLRRWHRDAGYDVAYISDHRTFEGAREGWANNPSRAADNTVLIPAIETGWRGEHVNVLDADRMFRGLLTDNLRDVDEKSLGIASALANNEPVLIETIPGDPTRVLYANGPGTGGARAIELIDGSPRGLSQFKAERERLVRLSDSLNAALVVGTDHHGWGYAAPGWTLMFIRNWRGGSAEGLALAVSRSLRGGGRASTRVVERYVAYGDQVLLPLTVPLVSWGMLRTLTNEERVVWLLWLGIAYGLWYVRRTWRQRIAGTGN